MLHSWFLRVQNVPIKSEYTGRTSLERTLMWHIKDKIWSRVSSFQNLVAFKVLGGDSIGFLDRLKMGDGLKMSDFGLGMS